MSLHFIGCSLKTVAHWCVHGDPNNLSSPLRVDPDVCIKVQGVCLPQSSYQLAAPIFWGIVVPSSIFILLVFGHELWRRICPLSFLSQIPRALGKQRQKKYTDKSGKVRYENADHGFFCDQRASYNAKAAKSAWDHVLELFSLLKS